MPMQAMVLLGINCGFGNADCATLPVKALDLQAGWVRFPRPKTGIDRRCPLWPETVAALQEAIASRPTPKDAKDAGLGVHHQVRPAVEQGAQRRPSPISAEFRKLLVKLGLHRNGLGFYALRHTFETIGGDSRDQVAVDYIMGHSRNDMASRLPGADRRRPAPGRDGTRQEMAVRRTESQVEYMLPGRPSTEGQAARRSLPAGHRAILGHRTPRDGPQSNKQARSAGTPHTAPRPSL